MTGDLEKKVRDLYSKVCRLEEEKYDWEVKIRKQDYEVCHMNVLLLGNQFTNIIVIH